MIIILFSTVSCFKEDEKVTPHGNLNFSVDSSIYDYQCFFRMDLARLTSIKSNNLWHIAFEASPEGWKININSSSYYGVYPTGEFNFDNISPVTAPDKYIFDASSGNTDSTAFGKWLDRSAIPFLPTGEIFLIGKYNGINYTPEWMVKFISYTDSSYTFQFSNIGGIPLEKTIKKDAGYIRMYFNLNGGGSLIEVEPKRNEWDFVFSQYGTILFTDEGVPTPYFVRGVLLNTDGVSVAIDSISTFSDIDFDYAEFLQFDSKTDVIGYNWKNPVIDFNSGTAVYLTRSDFNYIIKDKDGFLYKLRFIDFYNNLAMVGYPTFELQKL